MAKKTIQNKSLDDLIIKYCGISTGNAVTLDSGYLGANESGWTITGHVSHDYYSWINQFEAKKGRMWVRGDFEQEIECSSMTALEDFMKHHRPDCWDYGDI